MKHRTRRGEFIIEYDGFTAKVYDRKTRKKLFDGPLEIVLHDIEEKLEGAFDLSAPSSSSKTKNTMTSKRKHNGWW